MTLSQVVHGTFGFRTNPVTILLIITYSVVFIGVIVSDPVLKASKDNEGLNLEQAYEDLHKVAVRPRPFNSHANDDARAYILARLQNITRDVPYVHVVEDTFSNATWLEDGHAISFEGANILVRVDGTDPNFAEHGGVLFSAHYDSVSTGPGTTDDAIGVVSLIAFVEYLSTKVRTKRTAIFNINDGEEDGLHGAHLFLEHSWSRIPNTFINLEGAGAGGRPLLFRSTSVAPVRSFRGKSVSRPHGNVLSADAFSRGVVRSGTDFEVYAQGLGPDTAMEGIDFAFYQRRSKYHTRYDSVPSADGGRDSIWAMLETLKGAGVSLLNDDDTHVEDGKPQTSVYFDLFGRSFVIFTQKELFAFNVAMLLLQPLILLVLHRIPYYQSSLRVGSPQQPTLTERFRTITQHFRPLLKTPSLERSFWRRAWRWGKFWALLAFAIAFQAILIATIMSANRYIVHSQPYIVLISMLTLCFLIIMFFTRLPFRPGGPSYPNQQRLTILYQLHILSWILLVVGTALLRQLQIGGTYFLTGWNIFVFLAAVCGSVERILRHRILASSKKQQPSPDRSTISEEHALQEQPTLTSPSNGAPQEARGDNDSEPTKKPKPHERTPLITRTPSSEQQQETGSCGWWILQLLLAVAVPVILVSHILLLFLAALSQTLSDGSDPVVVYVGSAALCLLIAFPITPFAFRIHNWATLTGVLIFAIATIYNWAAFPFSPGAPLKVFFQQSVEVQFTPGTSSQRVIRVVSALTGVPEYIQSHVAPNLPSFRSATANAQCAPDPIRSGTSTCRWETDLVPSPGRLDAQTPWFNFTASRVNTTSALVTVAGRNTRSCRLYFDSRVVKAYDVYNINGDGSQSPSGRQIQPGYGVLSSTGISSLRLWSRVWERNFTVAVSWDENDGKAGAGLSGRVACEWSEHASGLVGMDVRNATTIPAYEEVLSFLPAWAISTKSDDGLVEVWSNFTVV